jgi:hypothetical protein
MAGKKIPVETVMTARDVNVAQVWDKLAGAAQHYTSVVGKAESAFSTFQTLATGGSVLAVGAGFTSMAKGLIDVNKALEVTTNALAGDVQVYKFATNFTDSMILAKDTLQQIKRDAIALPGTDTDFMKAFTLTLPAQAELGVRTLDEARKRSNLLTAVLLTKGVDSGQIGRDLSLMLRGHAGADVRSFEVLKGQLGVKDAAQWNALDAKKRLLKLDDVIKKNKDSIDAFGNTWEAVSSSSESYLKNMVLAGSSPLFEVAKKNLKAMNDYLEPLMPRIEQALRIAGGAVVAGGGFLASRVGSALSGAAPEGYALSSMGAAAPTVLDHLATAGMVVLNFLNPLGEAFSATTSAVMGVVGGLLPGLATLVDVIVGVTGFVGSAVLRAITILADTLGPALTTAAQVWSKAVTTAADVYIIAYSRVKPVVDGAVDAVSRFAHKMNEAFSWLASKLHLGSGAAYGPEEVGGFIDDIARAAAEARQKLGFGSVNASGGLTNYIAEQYEEEKRAEIQRVKDVMRIAAQGAKNKRPILNQDFRGSKFSIEQKFAQGFDPGRVLTAVREDSAKLAQRRLSAGNTPLFGGG